MNDFIENENKIENETELIYKFNNLLEIVFATGAFCLFKKRYEFINYLWGYHQPEDSDAIWAGHKIVPESFDEIIQIFFGMGLFDKQFLFFEDHHGSQTYFKKYFLLLLARVLLFKKNSTGERFESQKPEEKPEIPKLNLNLSHFANHKLIDIKYLANDLINISKLMENNNNELIELGFPQDKIKNIFSNYVPELLKNLGEEAEKQIKYLVKTQPISQKRIDEFISEFLKGFRENVGFREIFQKYDSLENKTSILNPHIKKYGMSQVVDKAMFFENWHVNYINAGNDWGRQFAFGEDDFVFELVAEKCKKIKNATIEDVLKTKKNVSDFIILASHEIYFNYVHTLPQFINRWDIQQIKPEIRNFEGGYKFENIVLPVYRINTNKNQNKIIIANSKKLGKLVLNSPLDNDDQEELVKENFYIKIQACAGNNVLIAELLNNLPSFLKKIPDPKAREEYLLQKAWLQIYEKIEYKMRGFEGFLIELEIPKELGKKRPAQHSTG